MTVYAVSYEERLPPDGIFSTLSLAEEFARLKDFKRKDIQEYVIDDFGDFFCFRVSFNCQVGKPRSVTAEKIKPQVPEFKSSTDWWVWIGFSKTAGEAVDIAMAHAKLVRLKMTVYPVVDDEGILLGVFSSIPNALTFIKNYKLDGVAELHTTLCDDVLLKNPGMTHYYVSWKRDGKQIFAQVQPMIPNELCKNNVGRENTHVYVWAENEGEAVAKALKWKP